MEKTEQYSKYQVGSDELVAKLVEEHHGWTTSIAKAVAKAWNMDWQLDGLDGGAYEALLFCARRFDPARGVPFRAYARRRIHEASTQEARKSKAWQHALGANSPVEQEAREVSAKLFDVFPEMREGMLPLAEGDTDEGSLRGSVRQLLASASLITAFNNSGTNNPESALEYKQLLNIIAALEPVHQAILWAVYWQGQSMRALAEEWKLDDLSVIREHKEILEHLSEQLENNRHSKPQPLKVRRGLRPIAINLKRNKDGGTFSQFVKNFSGKQTLALLLIFLSAAYFYSWGLSDIHSQQRVGSIQS